MPRPTVKQRKRQKRTALGLALLLVLTLAGAALQAAPELQDALFHLLHLRQPAVVPDTGITGSTAVHFIDVGQGDATLVEQDGEYALLDGGTPESADALLAYLDAAGVARLRYLILTHPHLDHYGGMEAVLGHLPVDSMVLPALDKAPEPTASSFLTLLETLLDLNVPTQMATVGDLYPLGSGNFSVLQAGLETDNYNLLSTILLFEAPALEGSEPFRYLSTGDAEAANENALLDAGVNFRASLFKTGHHGSSTSNSAAFVAAVRPSLAVVSCEVGNSYGHPHRKTLNTMDAQGVRLLRTDQDGNIVVRPTPTGDLAYATENNVQPAA